MPTPRQVGSTVQPQDQRHRLICRHAHRAHQPGLPGGRCASGHGRRQPQGLDRRDLALIDPGRLVGQGLAGPPVRHQQRHLVRARGAATQVGDRAVTRDGQALLVQPIARGCRAADVTRQRGPGTVQAQAHHTAVASLRQQQQQPRAVGQPSQLLVHLHALGVRQRPHRPARPRHQVHDVRVEGLALVAKADEGDPLAVRRHRGLADRAAKARQLPHGTIGHVELEDVGLERRQRVVGPYAHATARARHDEMAAVGCPGDVAGQRQLGDPRARATMLVRPVAQLAQRAGLGVQHEDVMLPCRQVARQALGAADQLLGVHPRCSPLRCAQRLPIGRRAGCGGRTRRHVHDEGQPPAVRRPGQAAGRCAQAGELPTLI